MAENAFDAIVNATDNLTTLDDAALQAMFKRLIQASHSHYNFQESTAVTATHLLIWLKINDLADIMVDSGGNSRNFFNVSYIDKTNSNEFYWTKIKASDPGNGELAIKLNDQTADGFVSGTKTIGGSVGEFSLSDTAVEANFRITFNGNTTTPVSADGDLDWTDPVDSGAVGDGVTDDRTDMLTADGIGGANGDVYIGRGKNYLLDGADTTLLSHYRFDNNAKIKPGSGRTVTFTGQITTEAYQIFDMSAGGIIALPNQGVVHAEWFGATGDDTADDSQECQDAVDALTEGGIVQLISGSTYRWDSLVTVDEPGVSLIGAGAQRDGLAGVEPSTIKMYSAATLRFKHATGIISYNQVKDLCIRFDAGATGNGIEVISSTHFRGENLSIESGGGGAKGMLFRASDGNSSTFNRLDNVFIKGMPSDGILLDADHASSFHTAGSYDHVEVQTSGKPSPVTITIVDYTLIVATDTVTVDTSVAITVLTAGGTDWTAGTSNDATALSLSTAINALAGVSTSVVGAVITVTETGTLNQILSGIDRDFLDVVYDSYDWSIKKGIGLGTNDHHLYGCHIDDNAGCLFINGTFKMIGGAIDQTGTGKTMVHVGTDGSNDIAFIGTQIDGLIEDPENLVARGFFAAQDFSVPQANFSTEQNYLIRSAVTRSIRNTLGTINLEGLAQVNVSTAGVARATLAAVLIDLISTNVDLGPVGSKFATFDAALIDLISSNVRVTGPLFTLVGADITSDGNVIQTVSGKGFSNTLGFTDFNLETGFTWRFLVNSVEVAEIGAVGIQLGGTGATLRQGSGVPGGGLGSDGDMYMQTGSGGESYTKKSGVWTANT